MKTVFITLYLMAMMISALLIPSWEYFAKKLKIGTKKKLTRNYLVRKTFIALIMILATQVVADEKCDDVCQAMKTINELLDEMFNDTTMEDRFSREKELLKSSEFEALKKISLNFGRSQNATDQS